MLISRREFLKTTILGTASLALTPSFKHLLGAPAHAETADPGGIPHRFVFIRKSNGNLTTQFGLPSFSSEELKKYKENWTIPMLKKKDTHSPYLLWEEM